MKNENAKFKGKRAIVMVCCAVLALLILIGAGVFLWIDRTLNLINRDTSADVTLSAEEIESILNETEPDAQEVPSVTIDVEETAPSTEVAEVIEEDDLILNILLIGQDRRENQARQRSDTMILCSVNLKEKKLVLTSFLRDTFVTIPSWEGVNYGSNRLNVCYPIGGMEMLDQCLTDNFGVVVDYNVEVDFFSFEKIVDIMGGVDIELTQDEATYLNYIAGLGNYLQEGMNHLDGYMALEYSRIRKLDSDFGRTDRQRKVLLALMENVKTLSLSEVVDIIVEVFPMITTDMSNGAIYNFAVKVLPVLSELQVTTQHIPADGTYLYGQIPGMAAIAADMKANRQILKDTIG